MLAGLEVKRLSLPVREVCVGVALNRWCEGQRWCKEKGVVFCSYLAFLQTTFCQIIPRNKHEGGPWCFLSCKGKN